MAENYTWTGNGSQDLWTTATLWDPDGTPTGTDNVLGYSIAGTVPSGIGIRITGNQSINNLTVQNVSGNSANNTGLTFVTQYTAATLNINGTLTSNNTGTGAGQKYVVFSDAGTPQPFTLNVGAVNVVGNSLAFGNALTNSTANKLSNLTVSGATTIANNTNIAVQSNNANFNGGVVLNGTGSAFYIAINRDTTNFSVSNHAVFGAKVSGLSGNGTVANAAVATAYNAYTDGTLIINGSSGTSTFSGNIVNGGNSTAAFNTLFLVKNGAGTQVLSGTGSTYSGGTTINAGTLLSKINGIGTRGVDFMRLGGPQKGILEDLPSNYF